MKNSKKSVKVMSQMTMDFLEKNYGILFFDEYFKSEIEETVEWFDLDIFKSISHLVEKYELQELPC